MQKLYKYHTYIHTKIDYVRNSIANDPTKQKQLKINHISCQSFHPSIFIRLHWLLFVPEIREITRYKTREGSEMKRNETKRALSSIEGNVTSSRRCVAVNSFKKIRASPLALRFIRQLHDLLGFFWETDDHVSYNKCSPFSQASPALCVEETSPEAVGIVL